jgi:hypothetical protein
MGQIAGVNDLDMHLLMNHSLPGVNAGYITRNKLSETHLLPCQQAISSLILKSGKRADRNKSKNWPWQPPRAVLSKMIDGPPTG